MLFQKANQDEKHIFAASCVVRMAISEFNALPSNAKRQTIKYNHE